MGSARAKAAGRLRNSRARAPRKVRQRALGFGTGSVPRAQLVVRRSLRASSVTEHQEAVCLCLAFVSVMEFSGPELSDIDGLLAAYIEYLWANLDGYSMASYAVAGVGWLWPAMKKHLELSKSLVKHLV